MKIILLPTSSGKTNIGGLIGGLFMATDKQVNYALMLLSKAGYNTKWMNRDFKHLGATMRERSGTVEAWLRGKNVAEISRLIDDLKTETEKPPSEEEKPE